MILPSEASETLLIIQKRLAESLVAVYLHGSGITGGLRPQSDVDLLAVINQKMTAEQRKCLASDLMRISGLYPYDPNGRRPIELIVFLQSDLETSHYPARCDFIYGEWLRTEYETGDYPAPVTDPELTLVLAQAYHQSMPLYGPNIQSLLPTVSVSDIQRAINDALPTLLAGLAGDERNVLLTLARMWQTLVCEEFVPKDVAANWAIKRLPDIQASVLDNARKAYLGQPAENLTKHQPELQLTVDTLQNHILEQLKHTSSLSKASCDR